MSNIVTALAKRRTIGSSARKAVLMYMADNASDDGSGIWTSKGNMALDLEMSRRTVQAHIHAMIDMGVVSEVGRRSCTNGFTVEYAINMQALSALKSTRAGDAPVQEMHPYPCSRRTPTRAGGAPKPSIEPPIEPPSLLRAPAEPDRFEEFWNIYPHRGGAKKGKQPARKKWDLAIKRGVDPGAIISGAERYRGDRQVATGFAKNPETWLNQEGWADEIEPDTRTAGHGNGNHGGAQLANGRENRSDPAIEQIARLAGLGEASGNGGG